MLNTVTDSLTPLSFSLVDKNVFLSSTKAVIIFFGSVRARFGVVTRITHSIKTLNQSKSELPLTDR